MRTAHTSHPAVRFLVRRYVELLTILALLFVLQTGLVPFDFQSAADQVGAGNFFSSATSRLTLPDVISNIFLYVPLGMLLHWSLARRLHRIPATGLIAMALAAATSGLVEWLQAYSAARVSSVIDLSSNVIGAAVGVSLSLTCRRIVPQLVGAAIAELQHRPQALMLKAYCLVLVVFAAIPFSFSFDTVRLKQAVRSANLIPFQAIAYDDAVMAGLLPKSAVNARAQLRWLNMRRWSRWTVECISFTVLAWLALTVLRDDYRFGTRASVAFVMYLGGAFALALTLLQLPIVSRACDVTDVLFRWIGVVLGLVARGWYLRRLGTGPARALDDFHRRAAKIGIAMLACYILYIGAIPFEFGGRGGGVKASIMSDSLLPFFAYYVARFDLMMSDAMQKFASYAVFAALLAFCWSRRGDGKVDARVFAVAAAGVSLSVYVEFVQAFIPVRVPSLTDPILAAAGCATGAVLVRQARSVYAFSQREPRAIDMPERSKARHEGAALPRDDALIATLIDPDPNAPAEPSTSTPRVPTTKNPTV
jgi:VanZ family protein